MPELLPEGLLRYLPATQAAKAAYVWFSDGHRYRITGVDLIAPAQVRVKGERGPEPEPGFRPGRHRAMKAQISVPADTILPMILQADLADDEE